MSADNDDVEWDGADDEWNDPPAVHDDEAADTADDEPVSVTVFATVAALLAFSVYFARAGDHVAAVAVLAILAGLTAVRQHQLRGGGE